MKNIMNKFFQLFKHHKPISKIDEWKMRGVTIEKNFDAPDSVIDYFLDF